MAEDITGKPKWVQDLAPLTEEDVLDDTTIIFSSDQGVHYGEHRWGSAYGIPAAVQKQTLYDPVVHVPLLAHGPDFSPGTTDVPVTQCDITATVVGIGGATPTHQMDGTDLRSIASRPDRHTNRLLLLQARTLFTPSPSYDALVTGPDHPTYPMRKFARLANGEYELYDLLGDPGELVNLAHDPDRTSERATFEAFLYAILAA